MVDVVVGSDSVVVVGGVSSIDVALDLGPAGQRGSQIFTDIGRPSDVILPDVQVNDLYINLKQSDFEYLYLYKYSSVNGVLGWSKVLRLVPNTVLANPIVRFINGEAHTTFVISDIPVTVKGLYFPLASLFPDGILGISLQDINVQHSVISSTPVSTGLMLESISSSFDVEILQPDMTYQSVAGQDFGGYYIRAFLSATEGTSLVTGYRAVHFLVTVGGRDTLAKSFDATDVNSTSDTISIPSHGLTNGSYVTYLNNGNASITGLTDGGYYVVATVDTNTVSLINLLDVAAGVIDIDASSTSGTHMLLGLLGVN